MIEWIRNNEALLYWLGGSSLVLLLLLPLALTTILVLLPQTYFCKKHRPHRKWTLHPKTVFRILFIAIKNTVGVVFIITGIALLVLPGQGLLTILLGLSMMNFPGKFECERWLITRGPALRYINWLRLRCKHPPLTLDNRL